MSLAGSGGGPGTAGPIEWDVRHFDVLDSTNRYVLDEARSGAAEGLVAVASYQESGRGRMDRRWEAPPGTSLLVSVLLRPELDPEDGHLVVAVAALAVADACEAVSGIRPALKWPNDLVAPFDGGPLAGGKLGGILAEADWSASPPAVVVGVGVNGNWPPGAAADLGLDPSAVALNQLAGRDVDLEVLLGTFLAGLGGRYASMFEPAGCREQMREYRARCATIGQQVSVTTSSESLAGTALDVDDKGHLLVDVGTCIKTIVTGDVVHVRPLGA